MYEILEAKNHRGDEKLLLVRLPPDNSEQPPIIGSILDPPTPCRACLNLSLYVKAVEFVALVSPKRNSGKLNFHGRFNNLPSHQRHHNSKHKTKKAYGKHSSKRPQSRHSKPKEEPMVKMKMYDQTFVNVQKVGRITYATNCAILVFLLFICAVCTQRC